MIYLIKISTVLPIIPISIYHTDSFNGLWWCQSLPTTPGNCGSSLTDGEDKGNQFMTPYKKQAMVKYFLNIINRNLTWTLWNTYYFNPERETEVHRSLLLYTF